MSDARKIEVLYSGGQWRAEIIPEYIGRFEAPSLAKIIDTVTQVLPAGRLIFVVDQSTIEGHIDAEVQFLEVSEKSGALIVGSGVWPMI